jgi:hypothetical protein
MRHIKSIILKRLKNLGSVEADEKEIYGRIKEIIKQKSTDGVEVLFYKNKCLYLKCDNSIVANEICLIQEEIKEEINKFFNKNVLNKIVIKAK